jgi:hypothetical protein
MANKRRYMYMHRGDNEWLLDAKNGDDEEWQRAWEELKAKCPHQIEITEDMYANDEYGDLPDWVDVTIEDSGVLPFKMARGVIGGISGARSVLFDQHFDLDVSEDWGGWDYNRLEVYEGGAFITFRGKHSSAEVEVNITEQFNQAIGETA